MGPDGEVRNPGVETQGSLRGHHYPLRGHHDEDDPGAGFFWGPTSRMSLGREAPENLSDWGLLRRCGCQRARGSPFWVCPETFLNQARSGFPFFRLFLAAVAL